MNGPVHWHEGMFLGPHHLQAGERDVRDRVARGEGWHAPHPYGLRELDLDADALADGVVRVNRLRMRLKDGTHLLAPGTCAPEPVPIPNDAFAGGAEPLVRVGVPRLGADRSNVAADAADPARFLLDRREVPDENEPGNPQDLTFRRLNAKLFVGDDGLSGYETLPLCRLRLDPGAGSVPELDDAYVPPLLCCDAWAPLREGVLAKFRDRLAAAASRSVELMRERGEGFDLGGGDVDLERLFRVQAFNTALPPVAQVAAARGLHPFFAYLECCRAVGLAAIFDEGRRAAAELPVYDHDDLGGCFAAVLRALSLDSAGPQYRTRPFHFDEEGVLYAELEQDWLRPEWRFHVGVASELPQEEVAGQLGGILDWKVARHDKVVEMSDRGLDSLGLVAEARPPRDFPKEVGGRRWTYWSIKRTGVRWREMEDHPYDGNPYLGIHMKQARVVRRDEEEGRVWIKARGGGEGSLQFTLFAIPAGAD